MALLSVTLIKHQLKQGNEVCISVSSWQIRTLPGFVPWAGQLEFSMLASRCDLVTPSFVSKRPDGKRRNSVFSALHNFQYIATDWVIDKILEYWFLGLNPSLFPCSRLSWNSASGARPASLLRTPFGCLGHAKVAAESQCLQQTPFCSCTWCVCRNDVLEHH